MKKNRKQIMESLLETIEGISDKNYQTRTWIMGEGPFVDDFDETVCHFFQEGDDIIEEYKEYGLTEHQYQLLKKFRDEFEIFQRKNHYPPEFINSPEWDKIMQSAKEVLHAFNYTQGDSNIC